MPSSENSENERIVLDYWKYFPERVLLSEKIQLMTARQFGAYWWICSRLMMEILPGVAPMDELKLIRWSRLSRDEWRSDRAFILAPFRYHETTHTLHQEFIKSLYSDYYGMIWKARDAGSRGNEKRWGKRRKGYIAPPSPPHRPQSPYDPP